MPTSATKRTTFFNNNDWPDQALAFGALAPLALNGQCYMGEQASYFDANGNFLFQSFSVIVISTDDAAVLSALNTLISQNNIPAGDISSFSEDVQYGLS